MEPEDLPWPGELEEEEEEEAGEEEEEVLEEKEEVEKPESLDEDEVVTVEDEEVEERRELDADFNYESQPRESTDDEEEDEEAKAWLQAHPGGTLPPPSLPKHRYSESEPIGPEKVVPLTSHVWQQSSYQDKNTTPISDSNVVSLEETAQWDSEDDQKTESWHFPPQEIDSSHTSDTTQTRFKVREEGTEMTDFPSVEEGILTQSENQVKEPNRDLFCSSLLVIQDSFASPDLPLLTCLTQDQEFGLDSLFHQSELDFAPLRAIPGKSEDTEWFSRPSEVSEALVRAASEVASDTVNSHFSVAQHTLVGNTAPEAQGSFLHPEQGTKEETVSSGAVDELKTPKDSDSYDALCSYMSWKTQEGTQEPETTLANKDQLSFSTSSDTSEEEYVTPKERDSFDASCLYVQYWNQEALQQSEKYLTSKDRDSCSDSSDTIDKNKISEGIGLFNARLSCMPWSKQGASHHPETCAVSKDHVSFPHEVASHFNNKMSYSFLRCLLERRGKSVPLTSDSHYFERVYLRAPSENEVKQKMASLEGYERNEEGLGKELSQSFELKENSNTLVFLNLCPSSSEVRYIENVVVPDNSVKVSETHILSREHDIAKVETSGGPLQTITSTLDETSEQLYFQEERNQKASAAFGRKNVNATENVAFEAVIASIEPSKKENSGNKIQTDITKSLTNYNQDSEPKNADLFLLNYNDANSFFDKFSHPHCQSTPGVFEPAASKPLLHKKDDDVSSLYWHTNAELLPGAPQEMFIRPLSSASLSEKSHSQVVGLCKTQSPLFQCGIDNEPFLPIAEKAGSSNIIYPVKVSTSDPLFLQDLKQQTFEEVADSSNYILGKNVNSSHVIEHPSAAVGSSFSANLVAYDAKSQGALPMTSDASLIAVGQETLLKADTGLGEIPRPMGAKSSVTVHTIIQNESYFVEGLQEKSESDICTLGDDTECCSLDENAVACSKRSTELQREMCDQGDLSGECIEVACLENLLDDLEICDSSLPWQSALQQPSKEESSFEEPVGHSDTDINQSFASVLPPFVPHDPNRELEYHSSDLRMLRVSLGVVPQILKHLSGDISEGSISEITQSNLKAGITTTSGDSDIGSYLPLTPEDFPQLVVRSSVESTLHLHTDSLNRQILADGHVTEEALKVLAVPELADQKTGISALPSSSYSLREKPSIFYPQPLRDNLTEGALTVSDVPGPADQKTSLSTVPPSSYLLGEKHSIFYQQALPDSDQTEEAPKVSALLGPADQKTEKTTVPSSSFSHRERQQIVFSQQQLPDSHLTEQAPKVSATVGPADQVTVTPAVLSTLYSHAEKPQIFFRQTLPGSHLPEQALKVSAAPASTEQRTGIPTVSSTSYSRREKPSLYYQQKLPESHLSEQSQQAAAVSGLADQKTGVPTGTSTSFSHGETPLVFQQQTLPGSHLPEQGLKVSAAPASPEQRTGIPTVSSTSYSRREKPSLFYQQELRDSHLPEQSQQAAAVSGLADQKTGEPTGTSTSFSHGETPLIFQQQTLPGSHLPEQGLKVSAAPASTEQRTGIPTVSSTSYSRREKPSLFYQQKLPESHPPEQSQQAVAVSGFADQKTGEPTGTSTSFSHGEKATIFYQQELRDSHLPEQSQQAAAVSIFTVQKTGIPTGTSTSFSHGETPLVFQQQTLPGSHLPEQALKVSAASASTEQKTGIPTVSSTSYSRREKPDFFYQQQLRDSHLHEQSQQAAAVSGLTDQKTGEPTGTSTSFSHGEIPLVFQQQTLPGSHLPEQALKVSAAPASTEQKTGIPTVSSTSYSRREKPDLFYQQQLRDSHLHEQSQQAAAVSGLADQKTGEPTGTSTSFSHGEIPLVFQQQTLPGSHLPEQALKVSAAPASTEQKTGIPTVSSTSYSRREKPSLFYQQKLPESHLPEQSQQAAAVSGFADQKTGEPTGTSTSFSHGEKATIFYQQELRDSHLHEQFQQAAAVSVFTVQKTEIPTGTSTSYSHGEKTHIFYQQTLPGNHLTEQALKVSAPPGLVDQRSGIPTVSSTSYSHTEKPHISYQKELPVSHLTKEAQKVPPVPGPAQEKPGVPVIPPTSYLHRGKTVFFSQQEFPDSHLSKEALKVSSVRGHAEQNTGIPSGSHGSYSFEEKPSVFYQQTLPDSHLTEESLKVSSVPGDQKTGILTVPSSSNSHREKPSISYQQELPDSHLTEPAQKVSAVPGPDEQKTGIPTITSTSYSHREKPFIFNTQGLLDSHLPEEALKVTAVPGLADQKAGLPSEPSGSYSHREKHVIFYPQDLPDTHLTEEALKVPTISGPADQRTGIPTVPSTSYPRGEKHIFISPQALPDSHLQEEALKVLTVSGPADQKIGLPSEPSGSYSHREKPIIFYPQGLTESRLPEEALKVIADPGPADQKAGIPSEPSGSYSHREKPIIFYPQGLTESRLPEEALKVIADPGPADQKAGIPSEPSGSYSHREKPIIFYPQGLTESRLPEEALKVSAVPGTGDQKAGIPSEPSDSYSHREKPIIFYPQGSTESRLPEEALKVSAVPGPADQKAGIPSEPSGSYSHREKPIIFYPQGLTESRLPEEALKVSAVPGTGDQKTGIPTVPTSAYSVGGKSINFYQQALPDRHITEEALNVSASPELAEQKTGLPTVSSPSYSQREKPFIFYPQALPDSQLTEEALKISAVPLPGDQNTRKPTAISAAYSHREKPIISYQQELPGSHLTEEALKGSGVPGTADQKTGIPTVPSNSYSYREKPIISYKQDHTQEVLKVLGGSKPVGQKTGIPVVTSTSYSHEEKPIISYQQQLPDHNEDALKLLVVPGPPDQKTDIRIVPSSSYSHREGPISSYQNELQDSTEETLEVSTVAGPTEQKTGIRIIPSGSYSNREKGGTFYQHELPDTTEKDLKVFVLPVSAGQQTEISAGPSSSYSLKEKPKISTVVLPDDQKTELPTASSTSYSHREKPKNLTVIGPDDQKTPLLTVFRNSYSRRVKPSIFFKQHLPGGRHSEDTVKASSVPEPTDVNSGIPISSSYSNREKSNILSAQELPEKHLTEDVLKVSTVLEPDNQKTVLPTAPRFFSHREKPNIFYQQDLPDRHLTEDSPKFSSDLGQADENTGLSTGHSGTYSHSEKHKLVSDHVQRLIDNLDSSNSSIISNKMPLNSQADDRVVVNKTEPSDFEEVGSEEIQYTDNSSKTLKQIQTLLMEAENIALKRCNFPAPLVPFRDVSDISFIQSKKVVCFKEPCTPDESNVDLPPRKPFIEENPSSKYIQKDINTETNLKCQRGIENWEFISSTTVRSPIQEAESKAKVALDETLRQYKAARSVMRSEPEGCSGTFGNKILIPMMTIIKSDSSSDASSCSWDSNSLESVSDVLLNLFPHASPKTSMTDSREEECVSESDDGGGSSVDSLAAHVKNLLKCESSLNHAKQILRNAEEEECRVRARAWNLKFNMAHECGYSISELNEDDRRKVEEIKAKLFGQDDLSKGLQSPRGIGCKPEAVCSHVIIESHEKGCFRTLSARQPQLDSHPSVFRSAEPLEIIRRQRSPLSWRPRHINLSRSLDQSNPHFKVWNSLQLQRHSPFQNFTGDDLRISKDFRIPFHEKMDPWLSELVEPNCLPPEEMDCHSSSQMLPPESMKKFTSITFSSHRHSKCFSDSSVLKVGVTEDNQCTGASVGVFNSHFTEEQSPPGDLKQKTSCPSLFKIISHTPDKAVTILAESSSQGQKLSVEHSHQEEKLLEKPDFKGSHSEPSTGTNCSKFKEVHFSDNNTLISMGRPSSTLGVKEKNVTLTPNPPSHIFLEQQELFEQSKAPHADHYVRKHHSPPPQHQHYVVPNLPCHIFLEKREVLEQSKTPHVDHQMREHHSPLPQGEDYIASDLPSSIFLEQRQLFEQSKAPDIDPHVKKQHSPLPQGQDCVVENSGQHKPKSHISNINVETKVNSVVSQSAPNQRTLVISPSSTPPSNRKALSCVHITISPKTSKLDSGALDKKFLSLDPASKTRMNNEFNPDLQTTSSRSLGPTSKLLTSKPVAHDQESLGFLGPKSSPDFQVKQSLPDGNTVTKDLKTMPFENSQIVTSRQTQVNFSDLEEYSNPEGTSVSADRSLEKIKPAISAFSGKLSSDAVTQITTESPGKAMFSSEIFINSEDRGHEISKPSSRKLGKAPVRFASSPSVQQITVPDETTGAQPSLLPYKPSGSTKMYYVPHLSQIPSSLDSKSDTTIESSHSGSNDAIAPHFPAQVLGTRDDDLALPVNIKHKEGIYSKRAATKSSPLAGHKPFQKDNADAQVQVLISEDENLSDKNKKKEIYNKKAVTKPARSEEIGFLQKDTADSSDAVAAKLSAQLQDTKIERLPDTKAIKQKEEISSKRTFPKEAWTEDKESLQINIEESRCHPEFENTTHSVFRSAKFYFHHPVHLPSDQDFCHESLGKSVFMRHSWKDFFQHHPDKQHTCLPPPSQSEEKTKTRIESVSINVNLENKEGMHPTKSQARDYAKCDKQINDQKKDLQVTPEPTAQHITSLNELWNKYQERQKQQKPPGFGDRKEVSLVERLDRLAKLLQHPITHSLRPLESTQDDSREQQDSKEWRGRQQQQRNKLQKKKRYKSLEKCYKNIGDLKKSKVLSTHQAGGSNQIQIEQVKFDKYILRKQPGFHYINSTSSDSRPSEDSELLTDTATNILSTTTSPVESDILTQTDKEVILHERSSSASTIDTARLIQAFGHERVCLSPRRIKLYSSITDHQRRYIEKRSKNKKKALSTCYPQMTSEHTRRKRIQVAKHMISSDSISSSTGSFWSSHSTICNKQNVHMLNKGVQAGNLEIVNGIRKHTRDVGVIFPTPSSSEVRVEEDSDVTTWSEEKIEEKRLITSYLGDKKLRKNKQSCSEGVSWFVPVENVKSGPKKENLLKRRGPGISWFAPITNVKPWREPLREQNWQGQHTDSHGSLAGPGRGPLKPFVRATLQESLQLHRPDFISRSGERIKRLKLIVQERKLQNKFQSEREALFNTVREWQGHRDPMCPLPKRGFLAAQKGRPIGKKEMIQRSKRIYEQLPEVQKKREEEKRRLEHKSYRLRAQLYKKKVTNQLLGRKVPWD